MEKREDKWQGQYFEEELGTKLQEWKEVYRTGKEIDGTCEGK